MKTIYSCLPYKPYTGKRSTARKRIAKALMLAIREALK